MPHAAAGERATDPRGHEPNGAVRARGRAPTAPAEAATWSPRTRPGLRLTSV